MLRQRYNYVAQTFEPFMQMAVSYELTTGMSYMLAMVTLAYLRPVFFQKHFINRRIFVDLIILRIISLIASSPTTLFSKFISPPLLFHLLDLQLFIIDILSLSSALLTLVATIAILTHKTGSSNYGKRRQFLKSFIAYCTPIILIGIPTIVSMIIMYIVKPFAADVSGWMPYVRNVNKFNLLIQKHRSAIMAICTFVALKPYRKALVLLLQSCFCKSKPCAAMRTTRIVHVSNAPTVVQSAI